MNLYRNIGIDSRIDGVSGNDLIHLTTMIRQASNADIPALQRLNDRYFGETRDYHKELQSANVRVYVYENGDEIVGISGMRVHAWNHTAWILNIFVKSEQRRQGIGKKLIKHVVEEARNFGVRCVLAEAPSNSSAPALFAACGFRQCGYNDRYYDNDASEIAQFHSYDL